MVVTEYDSGWTTTTTTFDGDTVCGVIYVYSEPTKLPEPEKGEIPDFTPKTEWDRPPRKTVHKPSAVVIPVLVRRAMISKSGWKPRRMRKRHRGKK